ncbi:MAG: hypothetical protein ACK4GN_02565 [Runella sp.]
MKTRFYILFGLGLLGGCTSAEDSTPVKNYYDLKGFITQQVVELEKRKPAVEKQLTIGQNQETHTTTDIDWSKELDLFAQADLNKPAYLASYTVQKLGEFAWLYTLKQGEKQPVRSLKIVLDKASQKPTWIEAVLQEENRLYESQKHLLLQAALRPEGIWLIKSYDISGFQHLSMTEPKQYQVKAFIR